MCQDVRNDKTWLRYWILEGKYIWDVRRWSACGIIWKSLFSLAVTYYFFLQTMSFMFMSKCLNDILNSWNYKICITVFVRESHSYDITPCLYSREPHLIMSPLLPAPDWLTTRRVPAPHASLNHISLAAACSRRVDPPIIILSCQLWKLLTAHWSPRPLKYRNITRPPPSPSKILLGAQVIN